MKESIFKAGLRSFIVSICVLLGLAVGLIPFILIVGSISDTDEIETKTSPTVLPNADGKRKSFSKTTPTILHLSVDGILGLRKFTADKIRLQLQESHEGKMKDAHVKAILLYINSPGGTVADADGIYRALKQYKKQYSVPIYVYADGMCASGGMYIAAAADKISASKVTIIGSIGVIINSFLNVSQPMEKLGIQALTLSAGKGKDELNPLRPWKPEEAETIQHLVNYYYQEFLDIVLASRTKMSREKLINDYGAKIFPAEEALQLGYIDQVENSYEVVLAQLVKEAGLENETYQVVRLDEKSWLSDLIRGEEPGLLRGIIKHELKLLPEWQTELNSKYLYLYVP